MRECAVLFSQISSVVSICLWQSNAEAPFPLKIRIHFATLHKAQANKNNKFNRSNAYKPSP